MEKQAAIRELGRLKRRCEELGEDVDELKAKIEGKADPAPKPPDPPPPPKPEKKEDW